MGKSLRNLVMSGVLLSSIFLVPKFSMPCDRECRMKGVRRFVPNVDSIEKDSHHSFGIVKGSLTRNIEINYVDNGEQGVYEPGDIKIVSHRVCDVPIICKNSRLESTDYMVRTEDGWSVMSIYYDDSGKRIRTECYEF